MQTHCRKTPSRRGAALIIILVVFAVTIALAGVWTRRTLTEHRAQVRAAERLQTEWLAEAGVRRAAARLAASADYNGEEWSIAADELGHSHAANVLITIEPSESSGQVRLIARARYPHKGASHQVTKSVAYTPPNLEPKP